MNKIEAMARAFGNLPHDQQERRLRAHTELPDDVGCDEVLVLEEAQRAIIAELASEVASLEASGVLPLEGDPDDLDEGTRSKLAQAGFLTEIADMAEVGLIGIVRNGDEEDFRPFRVVDVMLGVDTSEWFTDTEEE